MDIRFSFLEKNGLSHSLPPLFDMLYENIKDIAPLLPYDEERKEWLGEVLPAMKEDERMIILAHSGDELAGFLQYYVKDELLVIEEAQLAKKFRRTSLILRFARFLCREVVGRVCFIEAYAHENNIISQSVIRSLGMKRIGQIADIGAIHYRGDATALFERFNQR